MNKPLRLLAAAAAVIMIAGSLSSCGEDPAEPRYPLMNTAEAAENSAGRRFVITFGELDEMLEDKMIRFERKGIDLSEDEDWKVLTEGLVDDNGVGYTSYVKRMKDAVLTAAVENESKKLINVGCGCSSDVLKDDRKKNFVNLTAALADCVGGYHWNDIKFLEALTEDFLKGEDSMLYYEGLLFTRSEDEESVVIILSPSEISSAKEKGARIFHNQETDYSLLNR